MKCTKKATPNFTASQTEWRLVWLDCYRRNERYEAVCLWSVSRKHWGRRSSSDRTTLPYSDRETSDTSRDWERYSELYISCFSGIINCISCADRSKFITFRMNRRRREMHCGHARLCVCLCVCVCVCMSVCLSAAACPHYCTDTDVTWRSGRGCPLVVHYWADLQSVHGLRCYGNITRTLVITSLRPPRYMTTKCEREMLACALYSLSA